MCSAIIDFLVMRYTSLNYKVKFLIYITMVKQVCFPVILSCPSQRVDVVNELTRFYSYSVGIFI